MDFKGDVRLILLLGAGVVAAAWAVYNAGPVSQLVGTGTNGYVTMIQGLEPPQARGGIAGGAGAIPASAIQGPGGAPTYPGQF